MSDYESSGKIMVEYKLKRGAHTVTAKFEFTAPESEGMDIR